tara:strand:- start:11124 stop:11522 length:399 start_codon:yes stop_codon:yes gene_type:complete
MKEKDFINKIHKKLPKEIYKWKINDPYHGGVPDAFYSGPGGFCFVEYKYVQSLPDRGTSKVPINLSQQQRLWIQRAHTHKLPAYIVLGYPGGVCIADNPLAEFFYLDCFLRCAVTFDAYIDKISNICLTIKE